MSNAIDRARAEGYLAGFKAAYEDCAILADLLTDQAKAFSGALAKDLDPDVARLISDTGAKTAETIANSIREKLANIEMFTPDAVREKLWN